jgi:hypothetical protein
MATGDLPGERGEVNPYRPPQADSPQADMVSQMDGPSVVDVAGLLTIQLGMVLGASSASQLVFHGSWSGTALLAIVVGAMGFALLKKTHKPAPWTARFRRRLAILGALVWVCASGAILLFTQYIYVTQAMHWLGWWTIVGLVILCLLYFGATLFGLWVSSRKR